MIFDNTLTEQQMVENFIKEGGEGKGFIFKSYYDEENNKIILSNLYYDENNIMHEAGISQKQLGIPLQSKKSLPRYIMITGASTSKHGPRMKISSNGKHINKAAKTVSIYRTSRGIEIDGDIGSVGLNKNEKNDYINLFIRNEDLINFIRYNPQYESLADNAFIKDEYYRNNGYLVNRNRDTGHVDIFDQKSHLILSKDIWEEY